MYQCINVSCCILLVLCAFTSAVRSKVEKAKILSRHLLQSVLFSRTAKSLASLAREESIADVLASNRELLRSLMFVGGRDIHFGGVSHPLALEEARACAQVVIAELFEEVVLLSFSFVVLSGGSFACPFLTHQPLCDGADEGSHSPVLLPDFTSCPDIWILCPAGKIWVI